MLHRLGRHLTLLNIVVSGAILVVMAIVALGVAERTITQQNENEMTRFVSQTLAVLHEIANSDTPIRVQVPEKYLIYLENDDGEARLVATASVSAEELKAIAAHVRAQMADGLNVAWAFSAAITPEQITLERRFVTAGAQVSGATRPVWDGAANVNGIYDAQDVPIGVSVTIANGEPVGVGTEEEGGEGVIAVSARPSIDFFASPGTRGAFRLATTVADFTLADANGSRYRVVPTMITTDDTQNLVMVLQNREEELAAIYRLRWLFAGVVVLGLLLIALFSRHLSGRAIRPIDASIRQQRAFVAAASHELRTPVTALRANAEVLLDAPLGDYAPYLDSIRSVSERMSLLIADMIDLARADAGELRVEMTPVDADDVAAKAAQWMRPVADSRDIRLTESLSPAVALCDPDRLRQVLLALLDNAIRYTPAGGGVMLSVIAEGHAVRLCVADTGAGIPDEHKARVFDRFYRVDKARARESGGAGLGLSIVRQLVEQMHGTVTVADNNGGGTVFEIRLKAV